MLGKYKNHIKGVAEFARETAVELDYSNPDFIYRAGLMHDIGKLLTDDLYNETHIGGTFLKSIGSTSVGRVIEVHFTVKELIELQQKKDTFNFRRRFGNLDPDDYVPQSLPQKIITYADLHFGQEEMEFDERIEDLMDRYGKGELFEKFPLFVESIDIAYDRFKALCNEIKQLEEKSN